MASLCHPGFTDSQQPISPIGFLFLKLPPPPCAVLLVCLPEGAYDALCEMEISQAAKNPGNKGAFADVTLKIRDLRVRFSNQQANCKTHLKKPPPKAKGGAKRGARPKAKDEGDDE